MTSPAVAVYNKRTTEHKLIANGVDEEEYAAIFSSREPGVLKSGRERAAEHGFRAGRVNGVYPKVDAK